MLQLWPEGAGRIIILGPDLLNGMEPQIVVPRGIWQGARLLREGNFALFGTTVAPGFEFADYESGQRDALIKSYPKFEDLIISLTKEQT